MVVVALLQVLQRLLGCSYHWQGCCSELLQGVQQGLPAAATALAEHISRVLHPVTPAGRKVSTDRRRRGFQNILGGLKVFCTWRKGMSDTCTSNSCDLGGFSRWCQGCKTFVLHSSNL